MSNTLRQAVFPVAGMGTRLLPQTKVVPKEMLNILNKPLIQYAVEEAIAAGIEEFIFVTSKGKNAIEDHFDRHPELERLLTERSKFQEIKALETTFFKPGEIVTVKQPQALGLGHAVWCARHVIKDPYFTVLLPDDVIMAAPAALSQMAAAFHETQGLYVALMDVPKAWTSRYGVITTSTKTGPVYPFTDIVEKPKPEAAPSTLAAIGRYILPASIFDTLSTITPGAGGELQLTDAIKASIGKHPCFGYQFQGERFDCGTREGLIEANIAYGLQNPGLAPEVMGILKKYVGE
jgi:UTP--glucose-1-phosphate uridylyltransferase